jgi:hypothetical protein
MCPESVGAPCARRQAVAVPEMPRCWELRDNLTVYDAAYVALHPISSPEDPHRFLRTGQRAAHGDGMLGESEFLHSRLGKLGNQGWRERLVDRKVQRPLRALIAGKVIS